MSSSSRISANDNQRLYQIDGGVGTSLRSNCSVLTQNAPSPRDGRKAHSIAWAVSHPNATPPPPTTANQSSSKPAHRKTQHPHPTPTPPPRIPPPLAKGNKAMLNLTRPGRDGEGAEWGCVVGDQQARPDVCLATLGPSALANEGAWVNNGPGQVDRSCAVCGQRTPMPSHRHLILDGVSPICRDVDHCYTYGNPRMGFVRSVVTGSARKSDGITITSSGESTVAPTRWTTESYCIPPVTVSYTALGELFSAAFYQRAFVVA